MESILFEYRPEAQTQIEAAVLAAMEAGAPRVVLNLDSLEHLDSAAVRGLIVLLRRSREIGGELALRSDREDIRRSLHVMALDRLFPVVGPEVAA